MNTQRLEDSRTRTMAEGRRRPVSGRMRPVSRSRRSVSRRRRPISRRRRPVSGRAGGHVLRPAPPCALFRLRLIDLLLFLVYLYHPPSIGGLLCPFIASSIHSQPSRSIRSLLGPFIAFSSICSLLYSSRPQVYEKSGVREVREKLGLREVGRIRGLRGFEGGRI